MPKAFELRQYAQRPLDILDQQALVNLELQ